MAADYVAGQIVCVGASWIPWGLLPCDGRVYKRSGYQNLFQVIGNRYGGSATDGTFAVPNLGAAAIGCPRTGWTYCICWDGELPSLATYQA